jgi:hypothetical protein
MRFDLRHFFSGRRLARRRLVAGWVLLVGILGGCEAGTKVGSLARSEPMAFALPDLDEAPAPRYDDLAAVLAHAVGDTGLVDTYKLYQDYPRGDRWAGTPNPHRPNEYYDRLVHQLQLLAEIGPVSAPAKFADDKQALAYWWNARGAWGIYIALQANEAGILPDQPEAFAPYHQASFPLDAQRHTLASIDEAILALAGPSAVVTAPGITLHRAALPSEPFAAETVRDAIDRRLSALVDDPARTIVDVGAREIRYPTILWTYRDEFRRDAPRYGGTSAGPVSAALLPRLSAGAKRRLQNAVGYAEGPREDVPRPAYRPAQ